MDNLLQKIERKIKANCIHPIINKLQKKCGEKIKKKLNISTFKTSNDIIDIFSNKSVAIIGNSPILNNSGYGEKIDSYDIVIRINRGILKLDKENTGIKTDIWSTGALDTITSGEIKELIKDYNEKLNILVPYSFEKNKYKENGLNIYGLEKFETYKYFEKIYLDKELYQEVCDIIGTIGKEPTSGFSIIHYILKHTEASEIAIFGFSFSSENRISGDSFATQHNFLLEKNIINKLAIDNPKIKLFK